MLAQLYKWAAIVFAVLAVAAVVTALVFRADASSSRVRAAAAVERTHVLEAQVIRADQVIKAERAKAQRMAQVAEQYEQDKVNAQADADRLAADLRSGNVRLRDEWAGCETDRVSGLAASAAELDAARQLRNEAANAVVQVGRDADAKERAIQAVIRADRD